MESSSIVVLPDRYRTGWAGDLESLEKGAVETFPVLPLREALTRRYPTDAHAVQYGVPSAERAARLNKTALGYFDTHRPGETPELRAIFVDVDFPDHGNARWGWHNLPDWPPQYRQWWTRITEARERVPELQIAGIYMTLGGFRYVWELHQDRRVPVSVGEDYIEQFLEYLTDHGVPVDPLTDWTRLFRLPRVVRGGQAQDLPVALDSMAPLEWVAPRALRDTGPRALGRAARTEQPNPATLKKPTAAMLADLKDRPYYHSVRQGVPLAEAGARKIAMRSAVASIVAAKDTNDPLVPYQILLPCVEAAVREGSKHGPGELWRICVWTCQIHDGTQKIAATERKGRADRAAEAMACDPSQVRGRLILATKKGTSYYVWDEERDDYSAPVGSQVLLPAQLSQTCPVLSGIGLEEKSPGAPDLLRTYATTVDRIVVEYGAQRTRFDAQTGTLYRASCQVDPGLSPVYHKGVAAWLEALGGSRTEELLDWLATFLRLDRPTCALYLRGPNSIGKGLLADGLARLWDTAPVDYATLLDKFQASLLYCPLVVADESVPEDAFGTSDSSIFRRVIGNGRFEVEEKYSPKITVLGHPRVLITANDGDALKIRETLERESIDAIQRRIGYIHTDDTAREVLQQLASEQGYRSVWDMTEGWVSGGALARHVLHLAETRVVAPGDRFLVEGWKSDLTSAMVLSFGSVPIIGKFLARVIRDKRRVRGVQYGDGEVWINVDYLLESWTMVMGDRSRVPGDKSTMTAVRVLSDGERERRRPSPEENPRYFWRIDPTRIAQIAETHYLADAQTILTTVELPAEVLEGTSAGSPFAGYGGAV